MDLNLEKEIITEMKSFETLKKKNVNNHEHEKKHSKVIKKYIKTPHFPYQIDKDILYANILCS